MLLILILNILTLSAIESTNQCGSSNEAGATGNCYCESTEVSSCKCIDGYYIGKDDTVCDSQCSEKCKTCHYNVENDIEECDTCSNSAYLSPDCISETACNEEATETAGKCKTCNQQKTECEECYLPEQYESDGKGGCQLIAACNEEATETAGKCKTCNQQKTECEECYLPEQYESDGKGGCQLIAACNEEATETAGKCKTCNQQKTECEECYLPEQYESDGKGGCQLITISSNDQSISDSENSISNSEDEQVSSVIAGCDVENCETCVPGDSKTCQSCRSGYKLSSDGKQCNRNIDANSCKNFVSNCLKCNEEDPNICEACEQDYGLKGGFCTKCGEGLYVDNKSPCKPECTIDNCTTCYSEKNILYCGYCEEGYRLGEDKRSCVLKDCSEIPGCTKCNEKVQCIECDTAHHFQLIEPIHQCGCADGFTPDIKSKTCISKVECGEGITNCAACSEANKCVQCNIGYGLSDGKCTQCATDKFASPFLPCIPEKCSTVFEHCTDCEYDEEGQNLLCTECEDKYIRSKDLKSCIIEEIYNCSNIVGCKQCLRGYDGMCYQCDEDNNFEDSVANPGTCVCKEGYDYVNNQCIEAIKPAIPPPTVPEKAVALESGKDFTPTGTGNNMVYTVKDSKELDQTADSYKLEVPSQVATVTIPQIQKEIFVDLQGTRNDGVTINASASTPVTVNCQNGAKLNIPTKNDITISAGQSLNVDPIEENSENVNIGNLRPNEDRLDLTSKVNVTINELDIYGTKTVTGSSDDNKKTTCTNARLARGATFTPAKMIIENIEVGLLSKVLLNQPLGEVQVGKFFIDYNRTQDTNIPVPIIFENVIPVLNTTHLEMKKINADQELLEEEKFTLAQFNFGSATEAEMKEVEKQCQNLRENYDGGGDSGFNDKPECVKTSTGYDLVAKKQVGDDNGGKNDKGLSGGAIAGIVIACVVVVAAIIALLVYFLVIKKKNASTTSTQGDSSIAI